MLTYVYDPMCSWCWGYRPTWELLKENLRDLVNIQFCLGGLAPDCDQVMPDEMQQFLQQTWRKISQQLGTQFNFNFWQHCQPKRSTYNACRAVIVARTQNLEQEMYLAIQQGYYLHAQNPSDIACLIEFAQSIGLIKEEFTHALSSDETNQKLLHEIRFARSLPINGFPSLVLNYNGQNYPIPIDYKNWQTSFKEIIEIISS